MTLRISDKRAYLYQSVRENGRVTTRYVASGDAALVCHIALSRRSAEQRAMKAQHARERRESEARQRARWREERDYIRSKFREIQAEADGRARELFNFFAAVRSAFKLTMTASGYVAYDRSKYKRVRSVPSELKRQSDRAASEGAIERAASNLPIYGVDEGSPLASPEIREHAHLLAGEDPSPLKLLLAYSIAANWGMFARETQEGAKDEFSARLASASIATAPGMELRARYHAECGERSSRRAEKAHRRMLASVKMMLLHDRTSSLRTSADLLPPQTSRGQQVGDGEDSILTAPSVIP